MFNKYDDKNSAPRNKTGRFHHAQFFRKRRSGANKLLMIFVSRRIVQKHFAVFKIYLQKKKKKNDRKLFHFFFLLFSVCCSCFVIAFAYLHFFHSFFLSFFGFSTTKNSPRLLCVSFMFIFFFF